LYSAPRRAGSDDAAHGEVALMAAKKRRHRSPVVDKTLPNPGERQLCRLPSWWETADPMALERAHARGRQLIEGSVDAISWDELTGRR